MTALSTFLQTRRRLLLWLGGLFVAYTLLGFFLVPWLIQSQLGKILDERLSLNSEIESVYFNPFSFYFEIEGLNLVDPDQGALLRLGRLNLNFQPSRLALLKLQFASINIANLDIYYARNTTDDDTVIRLAERWSSMSQAAPDAEVEPAIESGDLIPLEVLSLSLSGIRTHILDEVPATPFSTILTLAAAQIDNFSTLPDQLGNNTLSISFEEQASLSWNGGFSVNPLEFQGDIALNNFSLLPVSRYLQDTLPFQLDEGQVNLSFNYEIILSQQEPIVRIEAISLTMNSLAATQAGETNTFLEASSIALSGGLLVIPENRAQFDSLSLQEILINASRDETGLLNFQAMMNEMLPATEAAATEPPGSDSTDETANPWFFALNSLILENNRISFSDNSLETPFAMGTTLNASMSGIDNQAESRFPLSTTLTLDSGGEIEIGGELQALPVLEIESTLRIGEVAIDLAQAYVNEFAFLELESGSLNLDAELSVNPDEPFGFRGSVALLEIEISDQQRSETIFSTSSLGIDAMSLSLAENNIDISELALEDFFARVIINEDGSSNIGRSIKAGPEASADLEPAAEVVDTGGDTPAALAVTVGRVSLNNASANFTDRNLPLPFDANIQGLNGVVQGFASNSSQATDVNLEGQINEFGLVQIVSSLNPFNFTAQSQIDVNFTNVDMPSMTPYVIKFAGREIAEGKVDLALSYELVEGELTANNQLVLSELMLGDRVEQAGAMDLPLDLAAALLKDGNGVIDLEVPITGNVNDPEFNFGPAIRRALTNILGNIVAAPFRLLGSLVGGDGDGSNLEQIRFLPGRSDIAAPEQETLLLLSEALKQRPQLVLEIPAMSSLADEPVLRERAVDNEIEAILDSQPESEVSLTQQRLAAVESLYTQAAVPVSLEEIRALHTSVPESSADPAVAVEPQDIPAGQLDSLAYIADLRDRLIAATELSGAELTALGDARQAAVLEYLAVTAGIADSRLVASEAELSEEDEDGWLPLVFGLTAQ